MAVADLDRITATLPLGYRARPFDERDRDALVDERNAWFEDPMEHQDANEWRMWEQMAPDDTQIRIIVEDPNGRLAGYANIGAGNMFRHPDGSQNGLVNVPRADRGKGIGGALLEEIEAEAGRRNAPRILSGASAAHPFALEWAAKRGYREIGRRIESYVDLASFDASPFDERRAEVKSSGITLRTYAQVLDGRGGEGRERFYREIYEAEAPIWEDVPFSTRTAHWPYERFRKLSFGSGRLVAEASIVAYEGDRIAGFTATGKRQEKDGYTWMTGTARDHRGRGLATVMKVEALTRARAKGLRAMFTTNDEPNKAMRGINAKLGYRMLPARVQLEKKLTES